MVGYSVYCLEREILSVFPKLSSTISVAGEDRTSRRSSKL